MGCEGEGGRIKKKKEKMKIMAQKLPRFVKVS